MAGTQAGDFLPPLAYIWKNHSGTEAQKSDGCVGCLVFGE